MKTARAATSLGATLLSAAFIAIVSCSGGTPAPVGVAQGCSINSDCEGDLVCVFGLCHVACVTSKDCNGEKCVLPGVCELPQEAMCSTTLPCVSGLTCVGSTCLAACAAPAVGAAVTAATGLCLVDQACVAVDAVLVCEDLAADAGPESGTRSDGGSRDGSHPHDARHDSTRDSGHDRTVPSDAPADAAGDAGHDGKARRDAGSDGGKDGAPDGMTHSDAGLDARGDGHGGTGHDASEDAERDGPSARRDGSKEAGKDAAHDAVKDAAKDAGSNSCPTAETQFGNFGTGTSMTEFTSGVGARNATQMFVFDGYFGAPPSGVDAGDDGGTQRVAVVYGQAFDPDTGRSTGVATPLFAPPVDGQLNDPGAATGIGLFSAAVSPGGTVALVYQVSYYTGPALYVAFLRPSVDAGAPGLEFETQVLMQGQGLSGYLQPAVIWSDAIQAFVTSWQYSESSNLMAVSSFDVDGNPAGVGLSPVPDDDNAQVSTTSSGATGVSGGLVGVAYLDVAHGNPGITVFNDFDEQVGPSTAVVNGRRVGGSWVATAGTATGFVYFYDNQSEANPGVTEAFLPVSPEAGVLGAPDAGDGSDAGNTEPFATFNFPSSTRAIGANAVSDGTGGVGVALLYPQEVSFAYVEPDGMTYLGPGTVFSHSQQGGDIVWVTNFAGSFVVSLYSSANHQTLVAATGCQTP